MTPAALALATLIAGAVATLPPPGITSATVLFRPGTTADEAFAAVTAVDGRVIWSDISGEL